MEGVRNALANLEAAFDHPPHSWMKAEGKHENVYFTDTRVWDFYRAIRAAVDGRP